jgi:hypothetical protein
MKRDLAAVGKRLVAGAIVATTVVGVSVFTIHAPTQRSAARSLDSIQTDKATLFYSQTGPGPQPDANWFVEQVLAETSESKDATENLKLIAAAL